MSVHRAEFPVADERVLITGGCGFIGSWIVRRLARDNHRVVVLDDLSAGTADAIAGLAGVTLMRGSVLDEDAVTAAARGCGLVFHLAGLVGKLLVSKDAARVYRVSVDGTRNVLAVAPRARVVVFSSSAVYGVDGGAAAREDMELDDDVAAAYDGGVNGYAVGKLHMERLAVEAARRGQPIIVVRPFNIVGPGQTGRYGMVIPRFVEGALCGQPLTIHGDGTQTRSFGHVATFVAALVQLLGKPGAWRPGANVFNLGAPRATSILELADEVLRVTGSSAPLRFVPYQSVFPGQRDVCHRVPDVRRLESLLGPVRWPTVSRVIRDVRDDLAARRGEDFVPPGQPREWSEPW